ncbi:hypothetical protein QBC35DRAFT_498177 [Podospora australis]|uniref:NADH:ubiquinone oxidoreductase intermediate-associated protein 30 domain-containing protein n=1 Tax=Podospora australis TaxID=1536484 RepID=A0AAN6WT34_9PEZI|nr:hypothetical protein QBC35DRAFT_498177 [Podospora australis]
MYQLCKSAAFFWFFFVPGSATTESRNVTVMVVPRHDQPQSYLLTVFRTSMGLASYILTTSRVFVTSFLLLGTQSPPLQSSPLTETAAITHQAQSVTQPAMSRILRTAILALLTISNALATNCAKTYEAKYDELTWHEPIETGNPIQSNYKGLDYTIFQLDQYDGFISPSSGNQYAMAFGGSGNITVHDRGSVLTLKSFSYACNAGVPQPECAISMWGFRGRRLVAQQVITFPQLDPGHYIHEFVMNSTTFDTRRWSRLTSVGFSISRKDNGGDMYGGLMIDDFKYTIST